MEEMLFYCSPIVPILCFLVTLVLYRSIKKRNERKPGSVSRKNLKTLKILLILSGVLSGILFVTVYGFIILISAASILLSLSEFLFYAVPVAAIVWFVVTLCLYRSAKGQDKREPGSVPARKLKTLKILLITSGVIASVFTIIVLAYMVLLCMVIAYM